MTVDEWVFEAVERSGAEGATVREVQRSIDERRFEELAIDTIEASLEKLEGQGRVLRDGSRWRPAQRTSKEDALKKLFGED